MKTDNWPNALTDILVAASLLTRLPLPRLPDRAFEASARATWAYPLAGVITGSAAALVGYLLLLTGLPAHVAAGMVVAVLMIATGAMHEDGLADVADGFWGGYTADRRLEIMKDSQIGTFGVLALVIVTGLRWAAYATIMQHNLLAVIAVATLSRATLPALMLALPNARQTGLSQSVGRPHIRSVGCSAVLGLFVSFTLVGLPALAMALAVGIAAFVMGTIARSKIGGQTGDVLGATQQMSEISALLILLIML